MYVLTILIFLQTKGLIYRAKKEKLEELTNNKLDAVTLLD